VYDTETSGSSGLRYDMDYNQYIYNWKTEKSMIGCFSFAVEIYEVDWYKVNFELK
jgi:hypothetical protein